ncbi:Bifunctional epoxide hydrolase 2, partial [Calypte anna]
LGRNFLREVMLAGGSQSPYAKVMRGQITLCQLFSEVEQGCQQRATSMATTLPPTFSVARAFEQMAAKGTLNAPLLRAARMLRRKGFKTCVFTNNWVDDSAGRVFSHPRLPPGSLISPAMGVLIGPTRGSLVSPPRRPWSLQAPKAVGQLSPRWSLSLFLQVIFLDDIGENLKPAREMGMATILVRDTETALKELEELSGVQARRGEEPLPTACDPSNVTHGYVPIRPGVQLHFVEMGQGPVVCLLHGFPESWLSWRYQIPALADAGFRVIALEMKGYGESRAPPDIEEYSQEQICKDLVVFLDKLGIPQAVLVGHDWGGAVVWNMALFYPERLRAVASLNTPYRPADPTRDILERMRSYPAFDYQFYFQEPGVAEAELERDIGRTLKVLIRSTQQEVGVGLRGALGGAAEGARAPWLPREVLESPSLEPFQPPWMCSVCPALGDPAGGPLNWYRNLRPNWNWALSARDRKILVPALMVTAGKDVVLHPNMSRGMEEWIPQLRREHLEGCGHWT